MKKLLTVLLALALFPVPSVLAESDETLDEQDIHDYLVFEAGSWWSYDTTTEDLMDETTETVSNTVTQSACDLTDDCYTETDEDAESTVYIEDNVAYITEINGVALSQNYTVLSVESYSVAVPDEDYAALGLTSFDSGALASCEADLDTDYSFEDGTYTALIQNCSLTAAVEGTQVRLVSSEYFLKGFGLVKSTSSTYVTSILFLETSMELTDSSITLEVSPFSDVETTDDNYAAIDYLANEEVFSGYADGTFLPESTMNRAELMKTLVEGLGVTPDETLYKDCFTDVGTDWYASYVCYAKEQGWVEGYLDGSFKPGNTVSKVEALKMLLLSQGVELQEDHAYIYSDVNAEDWFAPYVVTSHGLGILEEEGQYFSPNAEKDRKGVAENLYRLLLNLELPNASEAMAQGACLLFDNSIDSEELVVQFEAVMTEHGYEDDSDIDVYFAAIQDFSFFDDMETQLTADLEATCSADLEAAELTAEALAASMVQL